MTYPIEYRRKVLSVRKKEDLTITEVVAWFCVRWLKRLERQKMRYKPA